MTYRFQGHSMGDPQRYRHKDEVTKWEKTDPIGIYNRYLVKEEELSKADLEKVEKAVEEEVKEAVAFAESSPEPGLDTLFDYMYSDGEHNHG
jgi:pyruvate dehydrogenase E1 component alpha subunit